MSFQEFCYAIFLDEKAIVLSALVVALSIVGIIAIFKQTEDDFNQRFR